MKNYKVRISVDCIQYMWIPAESWKQAEDVVAELYENNALDFPTDYITDKGWVVSEYYDVEAVDWEELIS